MSGERPMRHGLPRLVSSRMKHLYRRVIFCTPLILAALVVTNTESRAQGIATAAIRGSVRSTDANSIDGARVRVVSNTTGYFVETEVRRGRFLIQGLAIGGPYVLTVKRLGYISQRTVPFTLGLGESLELAFALEPVPSQLDTMLIKAGNQSDFPGALAATIDDSLLHRLPNLNRDFYDFVRLTPHVSTKVALANGGMSVAGVGLRFNNYLIDGVPERFHTGNSSLAISGGKSVSMEAVREYQVLVTPFDVRYGDFAGGVVNAVTKSGSNDFQASIYDLQRDDRLARTGSIGPIAPYDRRQYGLLLSGPIKKDRLHFLIAPDFQHLTSPAQGPYLGQPEGASPAVPVDAADLARFEGIMTKYGLTAGSAGAVETGNPLKNLFTRVDLALPEWKTRAVISQNYIQNSSISFSRAARDTFTLSSYRLDQRFASRLTSLQLYSSPSGARGAYNELRVSQRTDWGDWLSDVAEPIIQVAVPRSAGAGLTILKSGTQEAAQGTFSNTQSYRFADNLTLMARTTHAVTLGAEAEVFRIGRGGVTGSFGTWTFSSLDSLDAGLAERFEARKDFGSASVPLHGAQYAAFIGDEWQAGDHVHITAGVRGDVLKLTDHAPYNALVDSLFGRRTDRMPAAHVHWSPRVGFLWNVNGSARDQVRGGIGIFTGRPPLNWAHVALYSYGVGIGTLRCGPSSADAGSPPRFVGSVDSVPVACANGAGLRGPPRGDVDLLDPQLRMAQTMRASLQYERKLPWNVVASADALLTRNLSDFVFVNMNLTGPQATDRFGRLLYGSIEATGVATPSTVTPRFSEVIDTRNTSRNHSYQMALSLDRRFTSSFGGTLSYTYSNVRDVETPLRAGTRGTVLWSGARVVSGRHDDLTPGTSLNDLPHRVIATATFSAPWRRWRTDFSLYYVGESGAPFTYIAWGAGSRGDLNADGSNSNDPIYVPKSAFDTAEILFSGASSETGADNSSAARASRIGQQQKAFEQLIERVDCLRAQRGRILRRNGCREPFSHTTLASIRQRIPLVRGGLEGELDVFNVLNLLNRNWGLYRVASPALLEQVGQTIGGVASAQPVFRFDASAAEWTTLRNESAFQLQLGIRYRL